MAFPQEASSIDWEARGLGYWKWKPLALRLALSVFPESIRYLVYVDAGFWVNNSQAALSRLEEYVETASREGGLTFSSGQGNTEEMFSKAELLNYMSATLAEMTSAQRAAGLWILDREVANEFAADWWRICNTGNLITDAFEHRIQRHAFIAHRNDQSVFSLLAKRQGLPMSADDIDIHPAYSNIGPLQNSIPFWAARHRSGHRSLSMNPIVRAARFIEQNMP